ncbi:hypothetical protein AGMMS49574_09620 [Bacteroidia bacterium]|nr:hypothetical protein AGMMS49574_09620 [Bacteroidia bacterium]
MKLLFSLALIIAFSIFGSLSANAQQTSTAPHSTVIKQAETPAVTVIAVDNHIKVENAPEGSRLEIFSVVGIKVAEIELKQSNGEYVVNIAKGYYIVRVGDTVRKIAIR